MEQVLFLAVGAGIGFFVGWLYSRRQTQAESTKWAVEQEARRTLEERNAHLEQEAKEGRAAMMQLTAEVAMLKTEKGALENHLDTRKQELNEMQEKFTLQFKDLAQQIFEEKNKQSKENLFDVLKPLQERIRDFENRVQQSHTDTSKQFAQMDQQMKHFFDMGMKMSQEANHLAQALKGNTKVQGNWGELILETILEKSGLDAGREFVVQPSYTTQDGRRLQPDVIVKLPDGKAIIIDSKVSLGAYADYANAATEEERSAALKSHVSSLRNHIRELGGKAYQQNIDEKNLGFVIMFVPVEPAFILAVQHDAELVNEAFDRRIYLTSPTLLIPLLQLIKNVWNQDKQTKNAIEIATKAGALYDKFNGFIKDLIKVGQQLDESKKTYEAAMNKLSEGKGNLVKRVEDLKKLGAKTTETIHPQLLSRAEEKDN